MSSIGRDDCRALVGRDVDNLALVDLRWAAVTLVDFTRLDRLDYWLLMKRDAGLALAFVSVLEHLGVDLLRCRAVLILCWYICG